MLIKNLILNRTAEANSKFDGGVSMPNTPDSSGYGGIIPSGA